LRCEYFFFSSRRRHTRFSRDWSSDVCSSDLGLHEIIIQLFTGIIEQIRDEKTGYQPLVSGMVTYLLGAIHSFLKHQNFPAEDIKIGRACVGKECRSRWSTCHYNKSVGIRTIV